MNRTVALIKVTRRGVAILLAIAVLVALAGLTRAENVTIEAKYWPDTAELRLRLFGESKYCDLNTTCEVEFDVDPDDIDFECDDGCGGGGVWNTTLLYTAIIDSRNDVMNAVARNASTCSVDGMERLGLIPTTDQQKALMDESRTSLYEFITRDVMPDVAEFNKLKADLESAELRLVESQKENEVQRVTFLNATDADKILIQELRDDKARINGRYDGAQLIILALVLYSSGALAFVLDKLRGAT